VILHRVDHRCEQVDIAALSIGVGTVEVEHEPLGVGPGGELAEVALSRCLQRGEPVAPSVSSDGFDEAVVAIVGVENSGDGGGVDQRTVARHQHDGVERRQPLE
jgi:hypothetical protein